MRPLIILAALVATILADSTINPPECGKRPYGNKVVGGTKANQKDWGWQVGMNQWHGFICGGSVLNSEWIVTAAHCVDGYLNPSYYTFDIGHHDRNNIESWAVSRKVTKVIAHPSYSDRTLQNDIALMKLDKPLVFTDEIVPVCIPDGSVDFSGKSSWATGWGTLYSGGYPTSRYLMEVQLPFLTDSRCKQKYSSVNTKVAVCAGETGEGKDTCQGDSGGPLVVENNGKWELAGITSWGYGCGDGGVYTRTSYYYNWIQQQIQNN